MITIFTKDNCVFCTRAKRFLTSRNINFTEYQLGVHFEMDMILETYPSMKTYPIIVKDDVLIGGYSDLISGEYDGLN